MYTTQYLLVLMTLSWTPVYHHWQLLKVYWSTWWIDRDWQCSLYPPLHQISTKLNTKSRGSLHSIYTCNPQRLQLFLIHVMIITIHNMHNPSYQHKPVLQDIGSIQFLITHLPRYPRHYDCPRFSYGLSDRHFIDRRPSNVKGPILLIPNKVDVSFSYAESNLESEEHVVWRLEVIEFLLHYETFLY